jgi:hypothetical protein
MVLCATPPCQLASGQAAPSAVALDSTHALWTNQGTSPAYTDGSLGRYDLSNGKVTTLFTIPGPVSIALGPNSVFWISQPDNVVGTINTTTDVSGTSALPPGVATQVVVDLVRAYVAYATAGDDGGVKAAIGTLPVSVINQPFSLLVSSPLVIPHMALDPLNVYWTELDESSPTALLTGGSVWTASKINPTAKALAMGEPSPYAIAVDNVAVYWSTAVGGAGPGGGMIKALTLATATAKPPVVLAQTISPALALTVDSHNLYWAEFGPDGSVLQMAKTPGAAVRVLAQHQSYPRGIAVLSGVVAWVNGGTATKVDGGGELVFDNKDGTVWAAPALP